MLSDTFRSVAGSIACCAVLWCATPAVQARAVQKEGKATVQKAAPPKVAAKKAQAPEKASAVARRDARAPLAKAAGRAGKDAVLRTAKRGEPVTRAVRAAQAAHAAQRTVRVIVPAPLSVGQAIGLKATDDPLDLRSSVALVVDQDSGETLFDKNAQAVLPIASITKLMTALVTVDAKLPLSEMLDVTEADVDTEKMSRSRLPVGSRLSRGEMLQLALMASENRAASALGRHFPGGMPAFVAAMNAKARALGMSASWFNDPTGLSSQNQSNARDLVRLMRAAWQEPLIREYSTAQELSVDTGHRVATFRNTNRLISANDWEIGLQKTGFINEAGNCVVMQTRIDGRGVFIVLLDAQGAVARVSDANRLKRWIGTESRKISVAHPVRARSA